MIGKILKNIFLNDERELELKEKELELKERELRIKEQELEQKRQKQPKENIKSAGYEKDYFTKRKEESQKTKTYADIKNEFEELAKETDKKVFNGYTDEQKKAWSKKQIENREKGKAFEKFVAEHYRAKGWEVEERGLKLKRKDGGIDLIAKKADKMILIQCKNYAPHNKIDHVKIKEFNSNCLVFIETNKLDKDKIDFKFAISNGDCLDKSAVMFFKDKTNKCRYEIVEFKN